MMMFRNLALCAICGSLLLGVASAQEKAPTRPGADRKGVIQQRMEENLKKLGITEEQKAKLKPILQAEMEQLRGKLQELRNKTPQERREALQKIQDETLQKIKDQNILTDEQIAKWKELRQQQALQSFQGAGKAKSKNE